MKTIIDLNFIRIKFSSHTLDFTFDCSKSNRAYNTSSNFFISRYFFFTCRGRMECLQIERSTHIVAKFWSWLPQWKFDDRNHNNKKVKISKTKRCTSYSRSSSLPTLKYLSCEPLISLEGGGIPHVDGRAHSSCSMKSHARIPHHIE